MREIKSGDETIRIRASNLTHTFFRQEFGTELRVEVDKIKLYADSQSMLDTLPLDSARIQDIYKMQNLNGMPPQEAQELLSRNADIIMPLLNLAANQSGMSMPLESVMRVVWAMNRAQDYSEQRSTLPYDDWVLKYDEFDFDSCFDEIYLEIQRGFFRSENK